MEKCIKDIEYTNNNYKHVSKKLLITGASGFVGYHLIQTALHEGYEVYAGVRNSSSIEHLQHLPIKYTTLAFGSVDDLKKNIEENKYNYIIHAAGTTKAKSEQEYNEINALYTTNLANAAASFDLKKFAFISSLAALGPTYYRDKNPINETYLPKPVTSYGRSKLLAERWISNIKNLPLIILRPTAVYGPREKDILVMLKALNKGFEPYIGRRNQYLSFVYVKDLANIAIRSLSSPSNRDIYNISDGKAYDRYELANIAKQLLSKKTVKIHVPTSIVKIIADVIEAASGNSAPLLNREKLNELTAENWSCSIAKARHHLQYEPKYDLQSGLEETLNWYQEHNWL